MSWMIIAIQDAAYCGVGGVLEAQRSDSACVPNIQRHTVSTSATLIPSQ